MGDLALKENSGPEKNQDHQGNCPIRFAPFDLAFLVTVSKSIEFADSSLSSNNPNFQSLLLLLSSSFVSFSLTSLLHLFLAKSAFPLRSWLREQVICNPYQ